MKHSNRLCHKAAGAIAAAAMCAAIPTVLLCSAQSLAGDVNVDGNVGVADIVLLQKYLLGQASLSQEQFENADVCEETGVDVFDLAILKRMVLAGQSPDPTEPTTPTVDPDATGVAVSIIYNGSTVTLLDAAGEEIAPDNSSNVLVSGSYVTITKAGDYTVSGTSADGQLKVSTDNTAEPTAVVTMSFAGLELSNSTAAPVYIENVGDQAVISVKKDTVNVIQDGTYHTDTYTTSSGEVKTCDAAIFARDDLKIKGKGTMRVIGNSTDGIVCTNDLKIFNSTLEVTAADDGIRGDTVKIGDADDAIAAGGSGYDNLHVTIKASAGDGIRASSTAEKKGVVTINGGTVDITAYADGIQAEQEFVMQDGDLNIYTYSGSGYTGSGNTGNTGGFPGGWGGGMGMDGNANKTDISAKGIKAVGLYDETGTTYQSGGNITINGGTIQIDSSDDALHCGGDMYLYGGVFTVATADDAFHSDHGLTIGKTAGNTFDDVQIFVSKCYEGVEGETINQNSGTVYIISGDDGYNAAGGADGSGSANPGFGPGGGWGQGGMSSSSGTLNLNGGLVVVNSASGDHDAFDSNGNLTITGGYYCANGQEPMDYDGSYSNNGGSVITMTAGNTSLNTRYSFVDDSGNVIVSFLSAGGNAGATANGCTAQSGGSISGGTSILTQSGEYAVTVGGTLTGASQITASSSSGGGQRPGRW